MWWWSALVLVVLQDANAYRVLFLSPVCSKSHKHFFTGIATALAQRDHQVTMVSPYWLSKEVENIREVVVPEGDISKIAGNAFEADYLTGPLTTVVKSISLCSDSLESEKVQALLEEKFDVVLLTQFFSECYLSLVHHMKVPFVYVSPMGLVGSQSDVTGNPKFPSFINNPIYSFQHPMTFTQRLASALTEVLVSVLFRTIVNNVVEWECRSRGLCPDDMPSINDMGLNTSLLLLNSVRSLETTARPYVPAVVHVGGIHCRPAKPLSQDLEAWVDGSGQDGFIFFSLGTMVRPSDLPEKYRQVFVKVFGSLKQRVLWKWDAETMPDLPGNVRLAKWLPQQDILGHPKLRLFITHGGLLSTYESIYHGSPVLGFPVFGDQYTNMNEVEREGWGKVMLWKDLKEEDLKRIILSLIQDSSIRNEVQQRSLLMRDQPMSPASVAAYWVEYVVRHNGAVHLRCPIQELPWFKLYNVDVWIMVLLIIILLTYANYIIMRKVCKRVFSRSKPKSD